MTRSRASSSVDALVLRRSRYSPANRSRQGLVAGSTTAAPLDVDAQLAGRGADLTSGRRAGSGRRPRGAAGCRPRAGSAPRRPRAARCARRSPEPASSRSCSNISGVTAPRRARPPRRAARRGPVVHLVEQRERRSRSCGRSSAVSRPRTAVSRADVSPWVPSAVATIGSVAPEAARAAWSTCGESGKPPLSTIPDICGKGAGQVRDQHAEHDLGTVARDDDHGALEEPVEHVWASIIAATTSPVALAVEQRGVAADQRAVAGRHQVGDRRGAQQRLLGQRPDRHGAEPLVHRSDHRLALLVRHLVDHQPGDVRVVRTRRRHCGRHAGGELAGVAVAGRGDQHERGPEVGGDGRVGRELGGRHDVGEVGAHHEHDVVALCDGVVAVDDGPEGRCRVGVQGVVGDAPRLVGGPASVGASWSSTRSSSSGPPPRTIGRNTPTRACRRANRATRPTATADLPDLASVPAR